MRERGLKLSLMIARIKRDFVAPHAGAWIETQQALSFGTGYKSLPMRERGLKQINNDDMIFVFMSLPMRERGLKLSKHRKLSQPDVVAPHAGAWIETLWVRYHS